MKKIIPFLMVWAVASTAHAFSFSAPATTGQTLYFTITEGNNVKVVAPATVSWNGYSAPSGELVIPATVSNNGTAYNVAAIDRMAFQQCYGLTAVTIPGSVLSIGQRAFAGDTMLVSALLDEGVQRIDMMAFSSCSALNVIELPTTLTRIAVSAFDGTAYYNNPENWSSEHMLTLGEWVLKVENNTEGTVHVHEGVRGIANNAFLFCRYVDKVVLPSTLRIIGDGAFKECYALDTIRLLCNMPPSMSDDSFQDINPLPVAVVPCSTATDYAAAQYWSAFSIVEAPCPQDAVDDVETATLTAAAVQGGVMVSGAEGQTLTVCDMLGRRIAHVARAAQSQYLPLPATGLYVLLTDKGAAKISYSR